MTQLVQSLKIIRNSAAAIGLAATLCGQTTLTSGVPVGFSLATSSGALLNGKNGYVIPVPSSPFELTVDVQIAPSIADVGVYARCGVDVGGATSSSPNGVYDTVTSTVNGTANLFLAEPAGVVSGNCYIAMQNFNGGVPIWGGRLTVAVQPLPSGTQVTVSSLASITLAGQPPGTISGNLSVPSNSPIQVPVSLIPGRGLSILGSGQISGLPSEGRIGAASPLTGAFGLSSANVPPNALVGVFLGSTVDSTHTPLGLDYSGSLTNVQTLYPLIQQVFEAAAR